ncbi:PorP/SprF family type IX secretion system membrane protein [Parafilimonas sp.]|uniref:PorP/SprF family type IX secretion system membrane protein n=1 Tax=Parafilimonas sp. TaxID=1969739 RepID=UPI0039E27085
MKLFVTIFCLLITATAIAQDPHFSQFFSSPLTLNPAFTGKFNGMVRGAVNYRNQWPTINRAYQTMTASVDFPILASKIPESDVWGVGLMGYSDKSAAGAVAFNYFSLSTAYHKGLDEDGYKQLGLGFQATYSNMLINTSKLTFEDQLTASGFTNPTQEVFNNSTLKANYFDLNAGILYTVSTSDRNNFYGGVSLYHINRPKQEFTGVNYELYPRATIHAGGYFPVGDQTTLHVSGLFSTQAGARETLLGGAMQFMAGNPETDNNPVSFYGGAWMRFGDALIPYIGLEFSTLRIGATYDINISDLKTASESRGGMEISLIYILQHPDGKFLPCPKF